MNPFPPVMVTPMPTCPAKLSELVGYMRAVGFAPVYGRHGEVIGFDHAPDELSSCLVAQAPPGPVGPARDKRWDDHDDELLEALSGRPITGAERALLDRLPLPATSGNISKAKDPGQVTTGVERALARIGDELARIGNILEARDGPGGEVPGVDFPVPIPKSPQFPAGNGPDRT